MFPLPAHQHWPPLAPPLHWGPEMEATKFRVSASREGAGDTGPATGSGWEGSRKQGSQDAAWCELEVGAAGYLDSGTGPSLSSRLEIPPTVGQREWEWGVPRAKQRPGSNPDTCPASHGAGKESSSLEARRASSSAYQLPCPDLHQIFAGFCFISVEFSYYWLFCGVIQKFK